MRFLFCGRFSQSRVLLLKIVSTTKIAFNESYLVTHSRLSAYLKHFRISPTNVVFSQHFCMQIVSINQSLVRVAKSLAKFNFSYAALLKTHSRLDEKCVLL